MLNERCNVIRSGPDDFERIEQNTGVDEFGNLGGVDPVAGGEPLQGVT